MNRLPYPFGGTANDSFGGYSEQFKGIPRAIVVPQLYPGEASTMQAPHPGTIGIFVAARALVEQSGPWYPDYGGLLPERMRPKLVASEPWNDPALP